MRKRRGRRSRRPSIRPTPSRRHGPNSGPTVAICRRGRLRPRARRGRRSSTISAGSRGRRSRPASQDARAYFDQGYRLAWGFNHAEAARAFRAAQDLDPQCAMCLWGEAWVLGPHINYPISADANARALVVLEQAKTSCARGRRVAGGPRRCALAPPLAGSKRRPQGAGPGLRRCDGGRASPVPGRPERGAPDRRRAHESLPMGLLGGWRADPEGQDRPDGRAHRRACSAIARLGPLMADPDHPGAIHLYIHADRSLRPAGTGGPARGAARGPDAGGRPSRAYAEPHLVSPRPLAREPRRERPGGRRRRSATRDGVEPLCSTRKATMPTTSTS